MHFGSQNGNTDYFFCTEKVQTTSEESDLGVIVSEELKVSKKCIKVVNTADRILRMIETCFVYNTTTILWDYPGEPVPEETPTRHP